MLRTALTLVLSVLCLSAQSAPQSLDCRGEEPFWRVLLNSGGATVTRPGPQRPVQESYQGKSQVLDYLDPDWTVFRGTSTRNARNLLFLAAREESCRSTMSDEGGAFTHRAIVSFPDGRQLAGCCRAGTAVAQLSAKPDSDWSRQFFDLLPAIQRCLLDGKPDAVSVRKAWPMNQGKAGVRLAGPTGAPVDCITDLNGRGELEIRAVRGADSLPGEGRPSFYPDRGQPPSVQGARVEQVLDASGSRAGWLLYPNP